MKKILLLLLLLVLYGNNAFCQEDIHCATGQVMKQLYIAHPEIKAKADAQDAILKQRDREAYKNGYKSSAANERTTAVHGTYTIPIVFHILYLNGAENISDAQVIDAVRILNRDYAKQNPDTTDIIPSFRSIADSTHIQFVLATKDTNGNCTNGIVHHYDQNTDWSDLLPNIYAYTWDPARYLNVYVVRSITLGSGFSAAGYAYFPGPWPTGDRHDAIVLLNNYFGSIGTSNAFLSRVLTHEAGHWFNLYHVFGSTNSAGVDCTGNDFVSDTPPTTGFLSCPDVANPSSYRTCNANTDENFQNYMDYSYCVRMFTKGQIARMGAALQSSIAGRNNLWSTANLMATGVINPSASCVPIADFKYNRSKTCVGAPVTFSDASTNGNPSSYSWSFEGGTPGTSIDAMPVVVYSTPGVYSVTYTSSTAAGHSAPVTKTAIITVTNTNAAYQNNWTESFETDALPNKDWITESSSGGTKWIQSSDAAYTGVYSAEITGVNNTRYAITSMISPSVNLAKLNAPVLSFQLATQQQAPNHVDKLQVFSSTDCGQTWKEMYNKNGASLSTAGVSNFPFIPASLSDWRMEIIDITGISKSTAAQFKFSYTRDSISGGANNIYIDDITIKSTTGINNNVASSLNLNLFPNPAHKIANISFDLNEKHRVNIYVTDVLGRTIETVINGELNTGSYTYKIGGKRNIESGIYFVNVSIDDKSVSKKIMIE